MIDLIKHKGDFLTFASIASVVCPDKVRAEDAIDLTNCLTKEGVLVRHPDLKENESRSDISRDGYIADLFSLVDMVEESEPYIDNLISVGWSRKWTMGKRGNFDYINIWPVVPLIYAFKYKGKMPIIIPPAFLLKFGKAAKGHRAHFFSLVVLTLIKLGYNKSRFTSIMKVISDNNKGNLWFEVLYCLASGSKVSDSALILDSLPEGGYGGWTGWGSCPNEVLNGLHRYTLEMCK